MILKSKIIFLTFIFVSVSFLYIGYGNEQGNAVAKDVEAFFLHDINRIALSVTEKKHISAYSVPLSFEKEIKHLAKRVLILTGIAIERDSYTMEFNLQTKKGNKHIYCLVRVHGDQVLGILIRSTSEKDKSAIALQKLLQFSFSDYDIPISAK